MWFRGEYGFLSNMYNSPITLGSVTYTCAEAAYQAAKLEDKKARKMFAGLTGPQAKALGRKIPLRSDWEQIKEAVMGWILQEKFRQNPELARKLRQTRGIELIEDNTWEDTFWGRCNGVGKNVLGELLMVERDGQPWEYTRKLIQNSQCELVELEDIPEQPRERIREIVRYFYKKAKEKTYGKSEFDYDIEKTPDGYRLIFDLGEDAFEDEEICEVKVGLDGKYILSAED